MRPEDNRPNSNISIPSRKMAPVPSHRVQNGQQHAQAAADVVRGQIDAIYQNDPHHTMPATTAAAQPTPPAATKVVSAPTPVAVEPKQAGPGAVNMQAANQQSSITSPYERNHSDTHQASAGEWQQYHSAWQSYYQQYYERYYVGHVHEAKKSLEQEAKVAPTEKQNISADEAMYDLRSKLRGQINERAQKVRKSRHFVPVLAGLMVMFVFLFLQYNRTVFAAVDAYVTPSSLDPSNLIIDPNAGTAVTSDPRLIIPKIGVDVPIIWNAVASSESSLNAAMDKGVAWFNIKGANARPGEKGNFALSGHSSNDWLDQGDYKFIFARLEQMSVGDPIYVNYKSIRYTYTVTKTQVVKPTEVSALQTGTKKPQITLITCTPLGTALNRLLVFGDQVSPDPGSAAAHADDTAGTDSATQMPANSPTFLERIFGLGN